jgi:hypothetical protein
MRHGCISSCHGLRRIYPREGSIINPSPAPSCARGREPGFFQSLPADGSGRHFCFRGLGGVFLVLRDQGVFNESGLLRIFVIITIYSCNLDFFWIISGVVSATIILLNSQTNLYRPDNFFDRWDWPWQNGGRIRRMQLINLYLH